MVLGVYVAAVAGCGGSDIGPGAEVRVSTPGGRPTTIDGKPTLALLEQSALVKVEDDGGTAFVTIPSDVLRVGEHGIGTASDDVILWILMGQGGSPLTATSGTFAIDEITPRAGGAMTVRIVSAERVGDDSGEGFAADGEISGTFE